MEMGLCWVGLSLESFALDLTVPPVLVRRLYDGLAVSMNRNMTGTDNRLASTLSIFGRPVGTSYGASAVAAPAPPPPSPDMPPNRLVRLSPLFVYTLSRLSLFGGRCLAGAARALEAALPLLAL